MAQAGDFRPCGISAISNATLLSLWRAAMLALQMKSKLFFALLLSLATTASAARYVIFTDSNNVTTISFTNSFYDGVCTLEGREGRRWIPLQNFFVTDRIGQVRTILPTNYSQFRLKCVDVSPGNAFTRLPQAYGTLRTVAGVPVPNETNVWREGALATEVTLLDPCSAVQDSAGNIYVAERGAHAVDKITPDGRIHTFVGLLSRTPTNTYNPAAVPPFGTNFGLNLPSALYIAGGGLYIVDAGNNRLVSVDLTTSISVELKSDLTPGGIGTNAAGLWVGLTDQGDVDEAFYGSGTTLKHLEDGIIKVEASNFVHISDVEINSQGRTIVADSGDNRVYRVRGTGEKEVWAGTGFHTGLGSGDAEDVALPGASGLAFLPIGGYFVSLDEGARIYYVDADDQAAPFAFGAPGAHSGDGEWFRAHRRQPKFSNVLSINLAPNGDILFVERGGIVRKIDFLRHRP